MNVIKTVNGRAPVSTDPPFTFQLRQGTSSLATGTILESFTTSAANGGVWNFSTKLTPNSAYQMCEVAYPGYGTTLGPPVFSTFNPGGNEPGVVCTEFTVGPGETKAFTINNIAPTTGGMASTIGFWKNWASCANSKGNQKPVLDTTVEGTYPFGGILIGSLLITDGRPITPGNIGTYCDYAVNILDKSTATGGRKQASDPVFNLASQFMAYLLNINSGSVVCPTLQSAAQTFLTSVGFNGNTHSPLTAAQVALANQLAGQLDTYNNNGGCPTTPVP